MDNNSQQRFDKIRDNHLGISTMAARDVSFWYTDPVNPFIYGELIDLVLKDMPFLFWLVEVLDKERAGWKRIASRAVQIPCIPREIRQPDLHSLRWS